MRVVAHFCGEALPTEASDPDTLATSSSYYGDVGEKADRYFASLNGTGKPLDYAVLKNKITKRQKHMFELTLNFVFFY